MKYKSNSTLVVFANANTIGRIKEFAKEHKFSPWALIKIGVNMEIGSEFDR